MNGHLKKRNFFSFAILFKKKKIILNQLISHFRIKNPNHPFVCVVFFEVKLITKKYSNFNLIQNHLKEQ